MKTTRLIDILPHTFHLNMEAYSKRQNYAKKLYHFIIPAIKYKGVNSHLKFDSLLFLKYLNYVNLPSMKVDKVLKDDFVLDTRERIEGIKLPKGYHIDSDTWTDFIFCSSTNTHYFINRIILKGQDGNVHSIRSKILERE